MYTLKYGATETKSMATPVFRRIWFQVYDADGYCGFDGTIDVAGEGATEVRQQDAEGKAIVAAHQAKLNTANGLSDDDALDAVEAWLNKNNKA